MDIYLTGTINNEMAESVIRKLRECNGETVNLIISSGGGSCYSAMAIIDAMKQCKGKIRTIGLGKVMSSAVDIFVSGDVRVAGKNTAFLIHPITFECDDSIANIKCELAQLERLRSQQLEIITSRTKITEEVYLKSVNNNVEWYLGFDEAKELNILDWEYEGRTD